MSLQDNPIFAQLLNKAFGKPQGQTAPVQGQPAVAQGALANPPAPAPVAPTAPAQTAPVQGGPPVQPFQSRQGSPNRGMNPLYQTSDPEQQNQPYNPYGYQPIPVYDSGGEVNVDENPSVLKRLGNKAKDAVSTVQSLPPNESEAQSLAEKQAQIDALAAQQTPVVKPALKPIIPAETDLVHPPAYGERPGSGQVLYSVDESGNITPVKVAPPAPVQPHAARPQPLVPQEQSPMKSVIPNSLKEPMPLYDQGGDVDVNDGKHQVAILQDGERVLTPEENERYKKEHPESAGAPADFKGRVVQNPKGYKPLMDTEDTRPSDTDRLPYGAKLSTDNAPSETPKGDISNPPAADVKPDQMREVSAKSDKAKAKEKVNNPGVQTETAPADLVSNILQEKPEKPPVEKPKETLGMEMARQWAGRMGVLPRIPPPGPGPAEPPADPNGPQSPLKPIIPAEQKAAPAAPVSPEHATAEPTAHLSHKERLAKYDAEIQTEMDKGTAEGHNKALLLQEAKQNFLKNTPWGSAENHPGVLGKLGHIGEMVASRTPFFGINAITASIPGSEGYRAAETENIEKQLPSAETAKIGQQNADTAESSEKNMGTLSQQETARMRELAATEKTGDPEKIRDAQRALADTQKAIVDNKPVSKVPVGDEVLSDDQITDLNKQLADRYQVLHPGGTLPPEFVLPHGATANDYQRRHVAMEGVEKATGTKTQQDTANAQKDAAAQTHKEEHADKTYDNYVKQAEKVSAPMEATASRVALLMHNLDAKDKQADAQVAPELLSIASGGVGSGLRMNEAEISRVIGGRSVWDALAAKINTVIQGNGTFDDAQRAQMRHIAEYLSDRSGAFVTVWQNTNERMLADKSDEDKVRKDYLEGKRIADRIVRQGIAPQGSKIKDGDYVFHNGQVLIVKDGRGHPVFPQ